MTTLDFTSLVRSQVTAIQGAARVLVDLSIGSILRSVIESNSAVMLWLQGLVLQLLATIRASTSSGSDLDTWMADFGFYRLAAVAATGQVTFSRFSPSLQAVVTIGSTVQTGDGVQTFTVTIDTTNIAYISGLGGYVLAPGTASVSVPVLASAAGSGGNILASQLNTMTSAIPGVDTVTNASPFTNGADAESDAAVRIRFVSYIASLSKATRNAIMYAITSLQQGLSATLTENYNYAGLSQPGYFYAVVDNGTGYPGSPLLSTVSNAIDTVRPFTSTFGVFAPSVITANIAAIITTAAGYDLHAVVALVAAAITAYVNGLGLGNALRYSRLAQVIYDASPGVINVTGVTINSATSDITATAQQTIKTGTVAVS